MNNLINEKISLAEACDLLELSCRNLIKNISHDQEKCDLAVNSLIKEIVELEKILEK